MKKVLIISYYWPPAGGITVLRCLKLAKYLREFGWEPVVFAPSNADYPYYDHNNEKDIPTGMVVIKRPTIEPFKLFKFLTNRKNVPLNNIVQVKDKNSWFDKLAIWIRGNYFIPDARFLWINPSVKFLKSYLKENPVNAIFTDGPPHTNTVIGTKLAQHFDLPYLADFQDPWTQVDYYKLFKIGRRADKRHKNLEQETFATADQITVASPSWAKDLKSIGAKDVEVFYYGYDEDDFKDIIPSADRLFTLSHAGLLGFDRNPENLMQALSALLAENPSFGEHLRIKLIGQIDVTVQETFTKYNLTKYVVDLGTMPRHKVLQELCNSWGLLLPLNKADNVHGRMPGKFYECMRTYRPIISFGPYDTDVSKIISDYNIGSNFEWHEVESLKNYIGALYQKYLNSDFTPVVASKDIAFFSNRNQTQKIAKLLDCILEKK